MKLGGLENDIRVLFKLVRNKGKCNNLGYWYKGCELRADVVSWDLLATYKAYFYPSDRWCFGYNPHP